MHHLNLFFGLKFLLNIETFLECNEMFSHYFLNRVISNKRLNAIVGTKLGYPLLKSYLEKILLNDYKISNKLNKKCHCLLVYYIRKGIYVI